MAHGEDYQVSLSRRGQERQGEERRHTYTHTHWYTRKGIHEWQKERRTKVVSTGALWYVHAHMYTHTHIQTGMGPSTHEEEKKRKEKKRMLGALLNASPDGAKVGATVDPEPQLLKFAMKLKWQP